MKQDNDNFYDPEEAFGGEEDFDGEDEFDEEDEFDGEDEFGEEDEEEYEQDKEDRPAAGNTRRKSSPARKKQGARGSGSRPCAKRKSRKRNSGRNKGRLNGHVIFFIIVALLLVITIIRLFIWNKGKHTGYDPNEVTTEFDTEKLDYIIPMNPSLLKDHEDDGVTTVLALGNNPFSDDRGGSGLAALIEKKSGAVVYNAAFPDSTIAMKNKEYENSYPLDALSLYLVTASLCNNNYDLMDAAVKQLDNKIASEALDTLKAVDLSKVDILTIFYDIQDYIGERIVYDENNLKNLNTFYGALNASIQLVQDTFPHIRIIVMSHTFGSFTDSSGKVRNGDTEDLGNGTLVDYLNWELEACRSNGVSFVDNFYGSITVEDTGFLTDGYHLNEKGREKIAERFSEILNPKEKD